MTTITFNIDSELKKNFKMTCTNENEKMTDILIDFIKSYIDKNQIFIPKY